MKNRNFAFVSFTSYQKALAYMKNQQALGNYATMTNNEAKTSWLVTVRFVFNRLQIDASIIRDIATALMQSGLSVKQYDDLRHHLMTHVESFDLHLDEAIGYTEESDIAKGFINGSKTIESLSSLLKTLHVR